MTAAQRPRVLFVNDEQRVLNSMRAMFGREYELFLTTNGAEALKIIYGGDIDVVVADHGMVGVSGLDILSWARVRAPDSVRVLIADYTVHDSIKPACVKNDVFVCLPKPCLPDQLRQAIAEAVAYRHNKPAATELVETAEASSEAEQDLESAEQPTPDEDEPTHEATPPAIVDEQQADAAEHDNLHSSDEFAEHAEPQSADATDESVGEPEQPSDEFAEHAEPQSADATDEPVGDPEQPSDEFAERAEPQSMDAIDEPIGEPEQPSDYSPFTDDTIDDLAVANEQTATDPVASDAHQVAATLHARPAATQHWVGSDPAESVSDPQLPGAGTAPLLHAPERDEAASDAGSDDSETGSGAAELQKITAPVSVLVYADDPAFIKTAREALQPRFRVQVSHGLVDCIECLCRDGSEVLLIDSGDNALAVKRMLGALQRFVPDVSIIAALRELADDDLAALGDPGDTVMLINLPLTTEVCLDGVLAALHRRESGWVTRKTDEHEDRHDQLGNRMTL